MSSYDPLSIFNLADLFSPPQAPQPDPYDPLQTFGVGTPPYNPAPSQSPFAPPPPSNPFDMFSYLTRTGQVEASGNPYAQNPSSSAGGLFQFNNETAKDYGLVDRFNKDEAWSAAERLTRDRMEMLRKALGREPTPGEVYLAHQQGGAGAVNLLTNPDARAVDVRNEKAILGNGGTLDVTSRDFANQWISKFEEGYSLIPPEVPPDFSSVLQATEDATRNETAQDYGPFGEAQQQGLDNGPLGQLIGGVANTTQGTIDNWKDKNKVAAHPLGGPAEGNFMSRLPEFLQGLARPGGTDVREVPGMAAEKGLDWLSNNPLVAGPSSMLGTLGKEWMGGQEAEAQAQGQVEALAVMKDRKALEAEAATMLQAMAAQGLPPEMLEQQAQGMMGEIERVTQLKAEARSMNKPQEGDQPASAASMAMGPFDSIGRAITGLATEPYNESRAKAGPQDWSTEGMAKGLLEALGSPFEAIGEQYAGLASQLPGGVGDAARGIYGDIQRGNEGQYSSERFGKNVSADLAEGDPAFAALAGTAADFVDTPFDIAGGLWGLRKLAGALKGAGAAADVAQGAGKAAGAIPEMEALGQAAKGQMQQDDAAAMMRAMAGDAAPATPPASAGTDVTQRLDQHFLSTAVVDNSNVNQFGQPAWLPEEAVSPESRVFQADTARLDAVGRETTKLPGRADVTQPLTPNEKTVNLRERVTDLTGTLPEQFKRGGGTLEHNGQTYIQTDLIKATAEDGSTYDLQTVVNGETGTLAHYPDRVEIADYAPSLAGGKHDWKAGLDNMLGLAAREGKPVRFQHGLGNQQVMAEEALAREGKIAYDPATRSYKSRGKGQPISTRFKSKDDLEEFVSSRPEMDDWREHAAEIEKSQRGGMSPFDDTPVERAAWRARNTDTSATADQSLSQAMRDNAVTGDLPGDARVAHVPGGVPRTGDRRVRTQQMPGSTQGLSGVTQRVPGSKTQPIPSQTQEIPGNRTQPLGQRPVAPGYQALSDDEARAVQGLTSGKAEKLTPGMTQRLKGDIPGLNKTQKLEQLFGVFDPEAGRVLDQALHTPGMENVARGIFTAAPSLGPTKGTPYDISRDVASAAHAISVARASGKPISAVVSGVKSDIARMLAAAWDYDDAPEAIAQSLKTYGEQVRGLGPERLGRFQGAVTPDRLIARIVDPVGSSLARVSMEHSSMNAPEQIAAGVIEGLQAQMSAQGLEGFFGDVSKMVAPTPGAGQAGVLGSTTPQAMAMMAGAGIGGLALASLLEDGEELPNGGLMMTGLLVGGLMVGMAASGGMFGPILSDVLRTAQRTDMERLLRYVDENALKPGTTFDQAKDYYLKLDPRMNPAMAEVLAHRTMRQAGMTKDGAPLVRAARAEGRSEAQARKEIRALDRFDGRDPSEPLPQRVADQANGGQPASPPGAGGVPGAGQLQGAGAVAKAIHEFNVRFPQFTKGKMGWAMDHLTSASIEVRTASREGREISNSLRDLQREREILKRAAIEKNSKAAQDMGVPANMPHLDDIEKTIPKQWRKGGIFEAYMDGANAPPGFRLDDLLSAADAAKVRASPEMKKAGDAMRRWFDIEADLTRLDPAKKIKQGYFRRIIDTKAAIKGLPEDIAAAKKAGDTKLAVALEKNLKDLQLQGLGTRYRGLGVPTALSYSPHRQRKGGLEKYLIRDTNANFRIMANQFAQKVAFDRHLPAIHDEALKLGFGVEAHMADLRNQAQEARAWAARLKKQGGRQADIDSLLETDKKLRKQKAYWDKKLKGNDFYGHDPATGKRVHMSPQLKKIHEGYIMNALGGNGSSMKEGWLEKVSGDSMSLLNAEEREKWLQLTESIQNKLFLDLNPLYVANRLQAPYGNSASLGWKWAAAAEWAMLKRAVSAGRIKDPDLRAFIADNGLDVADDAPFKASTEALPNLIRKVVDFRFATRTEGGVHMSMGTARRKQFRSLAEWMKGFSGQAKTPEDLARIAAQKKGKKSSFFIDDPQYPEDLQLLKAAQAVKWGMVDEMASKEAMRFVDDAAFNYGRSERTVYQIENPESLLPNVFKYQPFFMKQFDYFWNKMTPKAKARFFLTPYAIGGVKAMPFVGLAMAIPQVNEFMGDLENGVVGEGYHPAQRLMMRASLLGLFNRTIPSQVNPFGSRYNVPDFTFDLNDTEFNRAKGAGAQLGVNASKLGGPLANAAANVAIPALEGAWQTQMPLYAWGHLRDNWSKAIPVGGAAARVESGVGPVESYPKTGRLGQAADTLSTFFGAGDKSKEQMRLRADTQRRISESATDRAYYIDNFYTNLFPEQNPYFAQSAEAMALTSGERMEKKAGKFNYLLRPDIATVQSVQTEKMALDELENVWSGAIVNAKQGDQGALEYVQYGLPKVLVKLRRAELELPESSPVRTELSLQRSAIQGALESNDTYGEENLWPAVEETMRGLADNEKVSLKADNRLIAMHNILKRAPPDVSGSEEALLAWAKTQITGTLDTRFDLLNLFEGQSKTPYGLVKMSENLQKP